MRLFVGIYPDEELKTYLRDVIDNLQKYKQYLRFTPLDQIHLTIKFLGNDVSDDIYTAYTEEFGKNLKNMESFEVNASELAFGFKHQNRPRVLIMNMEDSIGLENLTQIATDSAKMFSYAEIVTKKEHKKLLHHITLARPKRIPSKSEGKKIKDGLNSIEIYNKPLVVNKVDLIQSILTSQGPIYKSLHTFKLKPAH